MAEAGQRLGSAGYPTAGVELRVVGPDGHDVPDGETGRAVDPRRQRHVRVLGRPEATDQVLRDGWYRSGDVVRSRTQRATSRSSGASATCSSRAGSTSTRPRSRPCCTATTASARRPSSASPTICGERRSTAAIVTRKGRAPSQEDILAHCIGLAGRLQAAAPDHLRRRAAEGHHREGVQAGARRDDQAPPGRRGSMTTRRATRRTTCCSIRGPGSPPDERDRMERYDISIEEVTVDHLVYSMGRQIENNFQSFYYRRRGAVVGTRHRARRREGDRPTLRRPGLRRAALAQGRGRRGEPRMMALYQDLVHSIRGPKHASALFAEYDDTRCIVRRRSASTSARPSPRTASTPRPSRPGASRATWPPTTTCWRSRSCAAGSRAPSGCEQHWVFKPGSERLGPLERLPSVARPAPGRGRRRPASLPACTSRRGRSGSSAAPRPARSTSAP